MLELQTVEKAKPLYTLQNDDHEVCLKILENPKYFRE